MELELVATKRVPFRSVPTHTMILRDPDFPDFTKAMLKVVPDKWSGSNTVHAAGDRIGGGPFVHPEQLVWVLKPMPN